MVLVAFQILTNRGRNNDCNIRGRETEGRQQNEGKTERFSEYNRF